MPRLTYANVVATLALFVALGGTSYAALQITGRDVRDGTLRGRDIRAGSLKSKQVKNGSLLARDFKAGQLPAGAPGPAGPAGPAGAAGAAGSDAANVMLAHVDTATVINAGSSYSGIAAAIGMSTADPVTDVVSLEMANSANATVTPVAVRASDLTVRGQSVARPVTVALKQPNIAQPYLQCTIAAGQSACASDAAATIPADTKLIVTVSVPAGPGGLNGLALALGWRAAPTG
jgi:hypothetical protein